LTENHLTHLLLCEGLLDYSLTVVGALNCYACADFARQCLLEVLSLTGRDPAGSFLLGPDQLCSNINMRDQVARWLQDNGVLA